MGAKLGNMLENGGQESQERAQGAEKSHVSKGANKNDGFSYDFDFFLYGFDCFYVILICFNMILIDVCMILICFFLDFGWF